MNDKTTNESKSADVDWVAFQYLAGDLAEDAVIRFEACLQDDQTARESLARAVELTQAVAMIESATCEAVSDDSACVASSRVDVAWMAPAAWLAVAALACVAFALFWNPRIPSPRAIPAGQSVATNDAPVADSGELASLWVDMAEFLVSAELVRESEAIDAVLDDELQDDELLESFEVPTVDAEADVDRLQAPSWMIAALAASTDAEARE